MLLDINLLKPSRIEFVLDPVPPLTLPDKAGFPDKADQRAQPGTGWTPAVLNSILHDHVVAGELTTFGCVKWQSQLFQGVMRASCYPFDMPKKRFHGFNLRNVFMASI